MKPHGTSGRSASASAGASAAAAGFPHWEISLRSAESTGSSEDSNSGSRATVSSSDYDVACGGATDCGGVAGPPSSSGNNVAAGEAVGAQAYVGTEFQNNWPGVDSATDSESAAVDQDGAARELVVKFASGNPAAAEDARSRQQQRQYRQKLRDLQAQRLQSGRGAQFSVLRESLSPAAAAAAEDQRVRRGFLSNASNAAAADATATAPREPEEVETAMREGRPLEMQTTQECCLLACTPLRFLSLVAYYVTIWAATVAFTYVLLEVSLRATSGGRFPYYMSGHSFFLENPRLGFGIGNPVLGRVTKYDNLVALRDALTARLRQFRDDNGGRELRTCVESTTTTAEAELMKPCNMTLFVAAATEKATAVLKDRPAALVEIRRHLGYIPASGPLSITCSCTAKGKDLPLTYYSWNSTAAAMTQSSGHGLVSDIYFPMLTGYHHSPSVLVALNSTVPDADWVGQPVQLICVAKDGSYTTQKRQLELRLERVKD